MVNLIVRLTAVDQSQIEHQWPTNFIKILVDLSEGVENHILIQRDIQVEEKDTSIQINSVPQGILVHCPLLLISLATAKTWCMKPLLVPAHFTSILKDHNKYVEDLIFLSMVVTAALLKTIHSLQLMVVQMDVLS